MVQIYIGAFPFVITRKVVELMSDLHSCASESITAPVPFPDDMYFRLFSPQNVDSRSRKMEQSRALEVKSETRKSVRK